MCLKLSLIHPAITYVCAMALMGLCNNKMLAQCMQARFDL